MTNKVPHHTRYLQYLRVTYLLHPSEGEVPGAHGGEAPRGQCDWEPAAHQRPPAAASGDWHPGGLAGIPITCICHAAFVD